jgi:ABC-type sugar transport system ATPase subunit
VARQLGQPAINLVPVRRVDGNWVAALSLGGPPLMPADASGPSERWLGIRPEDIAPDGSGIGGAVAPGPFDAVVEIVEYLGPTTTLLCAWVGTRIRLAIPRRTTLRPGDRFRPRINAARALLFDEGGSR